MLATRNLLKEHGTADFWSLCDELRERAGKGITDEKIVRNCLAFTGAVSMCYVVVRIVQGVQNYAMYAY